jgi:hypothetical protein
LYVQHKLNREGVSIGFADAEALHLGEPKKLLPHLRKYYDYGKDFVNYQRASTTHEQSTQLGFFRNVYLKNWRKFLLHPLTSIVFIVYNILKYAFGGAGYLVAKISRL